ncbi:hypothetical protein CASFOL_011009 [Castilleja foliolosa]|uniref:F-box/kelch-repeat protein SKIP25 n=1 Tax=Castilleja foliolosa TaxID=1961234 RepID=A0ABD3DY05_9LAMI
MTNSIFPTLQFSATCSTAAEPIHLRLKRRKMAEDHHQPLLPGLPDDIAHICLSPVPPSTLYSVCRSWRSLIYSPSFPPFLSLYAVVSPSTQDQNHISNHLQVCSFDPISCKWHTLPSPPSDPPPRILIRHRSFIARKIPIQSVTVGENLVVLAATDDEFLPALAQPLVFNPMSGKWTHGPRLSTPRRWCAAGASGRAIYVASGVGANYNSEVARTVDRWDLDPQPRVHEHRRRGAWRRMGNLRDVKFCRDAIDAVGWRGKLCMVNVKGDAAKDGTIYDVVSDRWEEMPKGMLAGWKGPVAAMAEETIYSVDETKGVMRKYDHLSDAWVSVAEDRMLIGAQQIAVAGGRVCVLCADSVRIVVVDVAAPPPARIWVVDAPAGVQVVGIHILPRLAG